MSTVADDTRLRTGWCVWLTGRAGAGKSTIARSVVEALRREGHHVALLDDGDIGERLAPGIEARAWLCGLLVANGVNVVVAADLPARGDRDDLRVALDRFAEVFVDRAGLRDDDYEEPIAPELRVPTHDRDARASIAQVLSWLEDSGLLARD